MIDTLQFADRLKDSGFENRQAEGMARALGDALVAAVEHLATKSDLETEITKVSARIEALDAKVETLDTKVSARIEALDAKVETLDTKVSARIEALDAKVEGLGTQIKFVFAALAMLLALGLIDTVPRLLG